jgi:phospho-N-acetylmuramoyl-pentapeptide-transferase
VALFEAVRILIMFALSFTVALFATPFVVHVLDRFDFRKRNIRDAGTTPVFNKLHKQKSATVTMAGVIVWVTVLGLALVFFALQGILDGFADYFNFVDRAETYLPLAALFFAAVVGLVDDVWGVRGIGKNGGGLSVRQRLVIYGAVALIGALWFYFRLDWDVLYIPFIGHFSIGPWYILFFIFILMAASFSTNEADGLDGLAGGVLFFAFVAMAVVAFALGRYHLAVMNAAILGALLAFLWFNIYPARFFMGDTGSMSLGITLGVMAMLTNSALFLPLFAPILVLESGSVLVQAFSKRFRGKKVLRSAPIHHHFEALGWHESQVTMRFWIISAVAVAFGLVVFFLARFA